MVKPGGVWRLVDFVWLIVVVFFCYLVDDTKGEAAFGLRPTGRRWSLRQRQPFLLILPPQRQQAATSYESWEEELCHECKSTTSKNINPNKSPHLDVILQRLNSPAPQSFYVLQRAVDRIVNKTIDNDHNFQMLQTTAFFVVKRGYQFVLYEPHPDYPLDWGIVSSEAGDGEHNKRAIIFPTRNTDTTPPIMSTLQIANEILDYVIEASQEQRLLDRRPIDTWVNDIQEQLTWTMGMDLRGRTSADAAFCLALAGVRVKSLFESLACITYSEIVRVGYRPSLEAKYILQMVEKQAAAGAIAARSQTVHTMYQVAADCLRTKREHYTDQAELLLVPSSFDLLSPRPLLWLWRFSARQKKIQRRSEDVKDSEESSIRFCFPKFQNPNRPLIVDLGCGMGTSLLGLATTTTLSNNDDYYDKEIATAVFGGSVRLDDCNLLGADLSQLAVNFAQGITSRWGLQDRLAYMWASAEDCLNWLVDHHNYQGKIALIMIQFPTPYRLLLNNSRTTVGNSQLPINAKSSSGFMVSDKLLAQIATILQQSGGTLLVQSNCEDVAVTVRRRAVEQHGMKVVHLPCCNITLEETTTTFQQTQRNLEWIQHGGERAVGPGWSSVPLLPPRGTTETEVACQLQRTPIHRCLLTTTGS